MGRVNVIPVNLGARSYRILVGAGALSLIGPEMAGLGLRGRVALVTDRGIQALHGGQARESLRGAGFEVTEMLVPEGEAAKTIDVAQRCWDGFVAARLDRTSTVVALGGGTVGDVAGFAAATYMRGVNFVQVPTTLLGQVDASSGGKTAIDHPTAKNLIGAFHQPRLVVVDTATLRTLPERDYRSGLAEVIKHGIVLDPDYFADLERSISPLLARDDATLARVVAGSCRIKGAVVERDETDGDMRNVLNYGHTIGHAVESVTGYARWTHGEAVALGIAAEARIATRLGVASGDTEARQVALLAAAGLPVKGSGAAPPAVLDALGRDKKAKNGRVPIVLAPEIGKFRVVFDVPPSEIVAALEELA
jgi:3-dehydroquinate synthase